MKKLVLGYELAWRTERDREFMKSAEWRDIIRPKILRRDNYVCTYCGFRSEKGMQLNHIDGNPKNNNDGNLEVICDMCHMILHSGLWCAVKGVVELYKKSNYSQNDIMRITRQMRDKGKLDGEIRRFLGLAGRVPWEQDLTYLSKLFGFVFSGMSTTTPKPLLTEKEQREELANREKW